MLIKFLQIPKEHFWAAYLKLIQGARDALQSGES